MYPQKCSTLFPPHHKQSKSKANYSMATAAPNNPTATPAAFIGAVGTAPAPELVFVPLFGTPRGGPPVARPGSLTTDDAMESSADRMLL